MQSSCTVHVYCIMYGTSWSYFSTALTLWVTAATSHHIECIYMYMYIQIIYIREHMCTFQNAKLVTKICTESEGPTRALGSPTTGGSKSISL